MPTPSRLSNSSTRCPASGVSDERLGGRDQGAEAGEADAGERPQAAGVEVGEFVEGVEATAMRVAGPGRKVLELAECGAPAGSGAEGGHHLGQRGDDLVAEQGKDGVGGEGGRSHYGTITGLDLRNDAAIRPALRPRRARLFGMGSGKEVFRGRGALPQYYRHLWELNVAPTLRSTGWSKRMVGRRRSSAPIITANKGRRAAVRTECVQLYKSTRRSAVPAILPISSTTSSSVSARIGLCWPGSFNPGSGRLVARKRDSACAST